MAGVYKRGGIYWGRVQRGGKEFRRSLETGSEAIARERLKVWIGEMTALAWGDKPRVTLNEAADRFIREHLPHLRPGGAKRYGVSLTWLDAEMGHLFLDQIGSAQLVAFETARRSAGATPPTVRRDLACLSSLFSFAQERELIEANPVGAFLRRAKKRGLRESAARTRYLSHDEEARLLAEAAPHLQPAIIFAIGSGLRVAEQFGLTWRSVDMTALTVTIDAAIAKGKRDRTVALLPSAADVLRSLPQHLRSPYVFWHGHGERYRHLDRAFKSAAKRAGIKDLRWHDLRRTHGCRLLQDRGWTLEMVKDQLGHSSVVVTERAYAFLEVDQRIARAGNRADTADRAQGG